MYLPPAPDLSSLKAGVDIVTLDQQLHVIGSHFCAVQMDHQATDDFATAIIPLLKNVIEEDSTDLLAATLVEHAVFRDVFGPYLKNLNQVEDTNTDVANISYPLRELMSYCEEVQDRIKYVEAESAKAVPLSVECMPDACGSLSVLSIEHGSRIEKQLQVGDYIFKIGEHAAAMAVIDSMNDHAGRESCTLCALGPTLVKCIMLHASLDGPEEISIDCFNMNGDKLHTLTLHPRHHKASHVRAKLEQLSVLDGVKFRLVLPDGRLVEHSDGAPLVELFGYGEAGEEKSMSVIEALQQTVGTQREDIASLRRQLADTKQTLEALKEGQTQAAEEVEQQSQRGSTEASWARPRSNNSKRSVFSMTPAPRNTSKKVSVREVGKKSKSNACVAQ